MELISKVYPLIVPKDYYLKGTWELPHHVFPIQDFILTWVVFEGNDSMQYITEKQFEILTSISPIWQQHSFENLRNLSRKSGNFYTHSKQSEDKKRIIFLSFLNQDGIGSSRILFKNELASAFPKGYKVAFPDRSCGMIIPNGIPEVEIENIKKMVKKMHKDATIPMARQLYDPEEFTLPANWSEPLDIEFSKILVESITD
ncbi:hypothetical protein Q4E93_10085 [Flavitalea sp. BT771]|uniref:hypothetical protein n=1 Tax=Flavitalea sp. BT771 TaxID=3063329 RepID=UPI0026E3BB33|nr:hypothetical protein [Flavitalea sp. BT771]MDO6430937.1 hypothetical protein [Flavitalea sp. BT771]MDV6219844.1 hypothetical protein [Flavitalea sp. BT771]